MIYENIKKLHCEDKLRLQHLIPFNQTENSILLNLESLTPIQCENFFENLLIENRIYFHESRTSQALQKQFETFKKLNLLKDQVTEESNSDHESQHRTKPSLIVNFDRIETSLDDVKIYENVDISDTIELEMSQSYDLLLSQIKRAEADLFLWQGLADKVTGSCNPFVEPDTLAVLFSEGFSYSMKKREIVLGRSENCDVCLGDKKVSRNHLRINMIDSDYFMLFNTGKMCLYVDGKILLANTKTRIFDKSIIEVKPFGVKI